MIEIGKKQPLMVVNKTELVYTLEMNRKRCCFPVNMLMKMLKQEIP